MLIISPCSCTWTLIYSNFAKLIKYYSKGEIAYEHFSTFMAVITIISDMGSADHYLAGIKGSIYSRMDSVDIVDITHEVKAFNIEETAFILKNCWKDFPKGLFILLR